MQERQVKEQQIEHAKKILKIQEQLKTNLAQVNISMLFLSLCYMQFTLFYSIWQPKMVTAKRLCFLRCMRYRWVTRCYQRGNSLEINALL